MRAEEKAAVTKKSTATEPKAADHSIAASIRELVRAVEAGKRAEQELKEIRAALAAP